MRRTDVPGFAEHTIGQGIPITIIPGMVISGGPKGIGDRVPTDHRGPGTEVSKLAACGTLPVGMHAVPRVNLLAGLDDQALQPQALRDDGHPAGVAHAFLPCILAHLIVSTSSSDR